MSTVGKRHTFETQGDGLASVRKNFHPSPAFRLIEFKEVPFDLRRVRLALFDSTYRSPITLLFPRMYADSALPSDVTMTVEVAQAVYEVDERDDAPAECHDTPEWYLRGIAHFTGLTGEPETAPMHVFLALDPVEGGFETAVVQIVVGRARLDPAHAD